MPDHPNDEARNVEQQLRELGRRIEELTAQLEQSRLECKHLREKLRARKEDQQAIRGMQEQLQRQAMVMEKDREVARDLQRSLMPVWLSEFTGVEVALESKPGARLAGDFYDVSRISDSTIAFLIADVSGYGMPAAVIMATARMAFRTFCGRDVSPRKILEKANEALLQSTLAGHYLTAFLGVLDTEMLTLQYANASHCCPYLVRGKDISVLDTEGLLVGMFEDPQYEEKCIQLEQDDKLFLFTDGLMRELQERQPQKGEECVLAYLESHIDSGIKEFIKQLSLEILTEPMDDVVLMGFQILSKKAREKTLFIPSIPGEIIRVEDVILPVLSAKGYGERTLFSVRLALEEAVINAIKHGNELDPTKKVKLNFLVEDDKMTVTVTDEGPGFDPTRVPDPWSEEGLAAESGRGLALMKAYMDDVSYNEKGNVVTMMKYAPWVQKKPGS